VPVDLPDRTLTGFETTGQQRSSSWGRRAILTVLLVFVLLGAAGWLGVRSSTERATAGGYTLEVTHASVARAGLDVPLRITVESPAGFAKDVTIAVTGDYFGIDETQGFHPEPSDSTRNGSTLFLTFTAPDSHELVVDFDAYVQPASQQGRGADIAVVDNAERPLVSVHIDTVLLP
jgi:hypothetical protein